MNNRTANGTTNIVGGRRYPLECADTYKTLAVLVGIGASASLREIYQFIPDRSLRAVRGTLYHLKNQYPYLVNHSESATYTPTLLALNTITPASLIPVDASSRQGLEDERKRAKAPEPGPLRPKHVVATRKVIEELGSVTLDELCSLAALTALQAKDAIGLLRLVVDLRGKKPLYSRGDWW